MSEKIYRFYGIETAMHLLRPGARWEIYNNRFSVWEDQRPCPTMEEVQETMEKLKVFEDSINTIFLPEQLEQLKSGVQDQTSINSTIKDKQDVA